VKISVEPFGQLIHRAGPEQGTELRLVVRLRIVRYPRLDDFT
jgi:hypothetical protein